MSLYDELLAQAKKPVVALPKPAYVPTEEDHIRVPTPEEAAAMVRGLSGQPAPAPKSSSFLKEAGKSALRTAISLPKMVTDAAAGASNLVGSALMGVKPEDNVVSKPLQYMSDYYGWAQTGVDRAQDPRLYENGTIKPESVLAEDQEYSAAHPVVSTVGRIVEGAVPYLVGGAARAGMKALPAVAGLEHFNENINEAVRKRPEESARQATARALPGAALTGGMFAAMGPASKLVEGVLPSVLKGSTNLAERGTVDLLKDITAKGLFDAHYLQAQGTAGKAMDKATGILDENTSLMPTLEEYGTNLLTGMGFGAYGHAPAHFKQRGARAQARGEAKQEREDAELLLSTYKTSPSEYATASERANKHILEQAQGVADLIVSKQPDPAQRTTQENALLEHVQNNQGNVASLAKGLGWSYNNVLADILRMDKEARTKIKEAEKNVVDLNEADGTQGTPVSTARDIVVDDAQKTSTEVKGNITPKGVKPVEHTEEEVSWEDGSEPVFDTTPEVPKRVTEPVITEVPKPERITSARSHTEIDKIANIPVTNGLKLRGVEIAPQLFRDKLQRISPETLNRLAVSDTKWNDTASNKNHISKVLRSLIEEGKTEEVNALKLLNRALSNHPDDLITEQGWKDLIALHKDGSLVKIRAKVTTEEVPKTTPKPAKPAVVDSKDIDPIEVMVLKLAAEGQTFTAEELQKKFKIGYNRARRILEGVEESTASSSVPEVPKPEVSETEPASLEESVSDRILLPHELTTSETKNYILGRKAPVKSGAKGVPRTKKETEAALQHAKDTNKIYAESFDARETNDGFIEVKTKDVKTHGELRANSHGVVAVHLPFDGKATQKIINKLYRLVNKYGKDGVVVRIAKDKATWDATDTPIQIYVPKGYDKRGVHDTLTDTIHNSRTEIKKGSLAGNTIGRQDSKSASILSQIAYALGGRTGNKIEIKKGSKASYPFKNIDKTTGKKTARENVLFVRNPKSEGYKNSRMGATRKATSETVKPETKPVVEAKKPSVEKTTKLIEELEAAKKKDETFVEIVREYATDEDAHIDTAVLDFLKAQDFPVTDKASIKKAYENAVERLEGFEARIEDAKAALEEAKTAPKEAPKKPVVEKDADIKAENDKLKNGLREIAHTMTRSQFILEWNALPLRQESGPHKGELYGKPSTPKAIAAAKSFQKNTLPKMHYALYHEALKARKTDIHNENKTKYGAATLGGPRNNKTIAIDPEAAKADYLKRQERNKKDEEDFPDMDEDPFGSQEADIFDTLASMGVDSKEAEAMVVKAAFGKKKEAASAPVEEAKEAPVVAGERKGNIIRRPGKTKPTDASLEDLKNSKTSKLSVNEEKKENDVPESGVVVSPLVRKFFDGTDSVGSSPGVSDNIQKFVRALSSKFNLNKRIYVASLSDISSRDREWGGAFRELYDNKGKVLGMIIPHDVGYILALNPTALKVGGYDALRIIAHEVGHAIIHQHYAEAPLKTQLAIEKDFQNWLARHRKGDQTAVNEYFHNTTKTSADLQKNIDGYHKRGQSVFDEYLAQQISKYIMFEKPTRGIVATFFKNIANRIKELYAQYTNANPEGFAKESVKEFMSGVMAKRVAVEKAVKPVEYADNKVTTKVISDSKKRTLEERIKSKGAQYFVEDALTEVEGTPVVDTKKGVKSLTKDVVTKTEKIAKNVIEQTGLMNILKSSVKDIAKVLFPQYRADKTSLYYAYALKALPKQMADEVDVKLHSYRKEFNKMSTEDRLAFLDKLRSGRLEELTDAQREFASKCADISDSVFTQLRELFPTLEKKDNHFGMSLVWRVLGQAEGETDAFRTVFGSRLEGTKSYSKKRSDRAISEIYKQGKMEPKFTDPIDIIKGYVHDAYKLISINRTLQQMQLNDVAKWVASNEKKPKDMATLDDRAAKAFSPVLATGKWKIKMEDGSFYKTRSGNEKIFPTEYAANSFMKGKGIAGEVEGKNDERFKLSGYDIKIGDGDSKEVVKTLKDRATAEKYAEEHFAEEIEEGNVFITPNLIKAGPSESGELYFPKDFANMINNHLSRDLVRENALTNTARKIKSHYTAAELSLSAFHWATITNEHAASVLGHIVSTTVNAALRGKLTDANYKSHMRNAIESIWNSKGINKLLEKYVADPEGTMKDPKNVAEMKRRFGSVTLKEIVDAYYHAGGMLRSDASLKANEASRWQHTGVKDIIDTVKVEWKERGKTVTGNAKFLVDTSWSALTSVPQNYLFEKIIPAVKLAHFASEYAFAIEMNKSNKPELQKTWDEIARDTHAFVEARFGETNWDNLWLNKTSKSLAQTFFRSATWKLGTIQAFYGGFKGAAKLPVNIIKKIKNGEPIELDHKMTWMISLLTLNAAAAAIIQTAITGETPEDMKDLMFPRASKRDPDYRVALPSYTKDLYAIIKSAKADPYFVPVTYFEHGVSGLWARTADVYHNRDFFNTKIRNPEENYAKQSFDVMMHLLPLPISITNVKKDIKTGESKFKSALYNVAGLNKAPAYVSQSDAEREAFKKSKEFAPQYAKTREEKDHADEVTKIARDIQTGDFETYKEALRNGQLSKSDRRNIKDKITLKGINRIVRRLNIEDALEVYSLGSTSEKLQMRAIVIAKYKNALKNAAPAEVKELREKAEKALRII